MQSIIKYIDNHILIAYKKANLLTQTVNGENSLQDELKGWIKEKYKKKKNVFLHPVHRIDKQVSGLVLFARTSKALKRLNLEMRQKKIIRKYIAEIEGKLKDKTKILEHFLLHLSHRAKIVENQSVINNYVADYDNSNIANGDMNNNNGSRHTNIKGSCRGEYFKKAKIAILSYKVVKEKKQTSIIEVELKTGRYHQIRAQFSYMGHPLVGDKKYFSKIESSKIHLVSYYLEFKHPIKKEKMVFEIKDDFIKKN